MKLETSGKTVITTRENESLVVVEGRSAELDRIDIDFKDHTIRVYSNKPWPVGSFKRDGTPMDMENPLVSVMMCFKDGAVLHQDFKTPVPQAKAMTSLGHFVAEMGAELNIEV